MLALQALCAFDVQGDAFAAALGEFLNDPVNFVDLGWRGRCEPEVVSLAREFAEGAWAHHAQCDALISRHVTDWSLERLQPVDRNIIRLGLYELLEMPGTPPAVVINEAVELARIFGGTDSPAFVNGVLDGLRREILAASAPPASTGRETDATG